MDTGGLAQMTYNSQFNNGLGIPHAGFASRGKGSHISRLSVPPPPKISTIDETQQVNASSTPRTSRGHLLAGLRTAPKSATVAPTSFRNGLESSRYADAQQTQRVPQTAAAAYFPQQAQGMNNGRQIYSLPEHVLAPPILEFNDGAGEEIDPKIYEELRATNAYLAQQQRALQQQLINVTAAAQQFGGLNLNNGYGQQYQSPMSLYNQQLQQGLQPIVQAVPNNPGIYSVFNPMTGQQSFVVDPAYQQQQQQESPPPAYQSVAKSATPPTPSFRVTPPQVSAAPVDTIRARSPPKTTPSPAQNVEPLPPPSANAFRRGHMKSLSSVVGIKSVSETLKSAGPKSAGYPQTPMTGTFGPGQARAGEHPVRQPRGPPGIEELVSKPTSKHEGSKNFATRQRRRAVHNLVRAGIERRGDRTTGSGSATPASENEFNFSVSSSDNDDVLQSSGSLSSKPSVSSLRTGGPGVIGSERKSSRDRGSVDSIGGYSTKSLSSEEGVVEVEASRRKTPMLVLSSAEKRKSAIM